MVDPNDVTGVQNVHGTPMSLLLSISKDIGDVKGKVGEMHGLIEASNSLHNNCPARLDFIERGKRNKKKDSNAPSKYNNPLWKLAPWLIVALLAGSALGGFILAQIVDGVNTPNAIAFPLKSP